MLAVQMSDDELTPELADSDALDLFFEREALERSLYEYVKAAWHLVEPSQSFVENWHIEEMCAILQNTKNYVGPKRVIFNVPPGTLKSLLIEVFFPTWVWALNAKKRFMTASYGAHLTMRDNLRARQIIESPWYQARWPVQLQEDQNTKTRFNTTEHGWRIATSVNGQGIGEHPDFIIIDDPHTDAQAQSPVERQSALDWFDRTIATRLGRNPAIIVVMQRLHENDLSGHLLKRGGWLHICWPMRYEKCACPPNVIDDDKRCVYHKANPTWKPDPRDHRTEQDELLFPTLFPLDKVKQLELDLGAYGTAGQLQQHPSPEGGGLFKREWFSGKFVDVAPALMRIVRGWDTAASEGKGDYTCGCKIGEEFEWRLISANGLTPARRRFVSTGRIFILDMQRGQLSPDGVDKMIKTTAELDGKKCPQREEREGGASGKAVIGARAKLLKGYDYKEVTLGSNKVVRAKPLRSQAEAGNVYILRDRGVGGAEGHGWNEDFIKELCAFPTGAHDDQVDAASCAYNCVLLEDPPVRQELTF
jgi:predicted phage terminase large subunit-like protein